MLTWCSYKFQHVSSDKLRMRLVPPEKAQISQSVPPLFQGLTSSLFSLGMRVSLHCTYLVYLVVSLQGCPLYLAASGVLHPREHLPPQLDFSVLILCLIKCKQKESHNKPVSNIYCRHYAVI